jgi:hypothetical protein
MAWFDGSRKRGPGTVERSITFMVASTAIPSSHADLLDSTALAHVATVGPDGEPQNNPVWFGTDNGNILFSQTKTR